MMGKREIGKLSITDLIVSILIAELAALGIEKYGTNLWDFVIPIILLTIFQIIMAYLSMKSNMFRDFFEGEPAVVIKNGVINTHNMKKNRYNLKDLLMQLREQGVRSVSEVEYAILENNGSLSIFKYNILKIPTSFPLPVITDGKISETSLIETKKSHSWVKNQLINENIDLKDVFYGYYSGICSKTLKLVRKKMK